MRNHGIVFPLNVKSTPCRTMTRSYWDYALQRRVQVSVKAEPLIEIRLLSNQLYYIVWAIGSSAEMWVTR